MTLWNLTRSEMRHPSPERGGGTMRSMVGGAAGRRTRDVQRINFVNPVAPPGGSNLCGRSRRSFRGGGRECATQVGFTRLGRFMMLNSATAEFSGAGAQHTKR